MDIIEEQRVLRSENHMSMRVRVRACARLCEYARVCSSIHVRV